MSKVFLYNSESGNYLVKELEWTIGAFQLKWPILLKSTIWILWLINAIKTGSTQE